MRKRVLLAIGGTVASVVMGASAVNGSFAERSSLYDCVGGKRAFAEDHFFDARTNTVECARGGNSVGTDERTSPTSSTK